MRIVSRTAPAGALVEDYLANREAAVRFYGGGHPADREAWRARIAEVDDAFDRDARQRLASFLSGGGAERERRLARFLDEDGIAVTTGQQPVLLGGPLFTLYKALGAVALADRLETEFDRPVLPVFWVASQDHDWDEVRHTHLSDTANELRTVELSLPEGLPPLPFHAVDLGPELDEARRSLLSWLPDSDFAPAWTDLLERTHGHASTLPTAEAELLESLLAEFGVFVLRPEHPEAARAALPVLLDELRHAADSEKAVRERGRELVESGYELQVPLLEDGTNVFLQTEEGRDRLFRVRDGLFRTRHGDEELTLEELEALAAESPHRLSPNVLLRPVVESLLVPTVAYMAGPGESAYFPQTDPLFRLRDRTPPIVHPRPSAFLVESKVDKVLEKFDLEIDELARPHHELAGRLSREDIPEAIRSAMGGLRGEIARRTRDLSDAVRELDASLAGTVDGVRKQGFSALDDLEKKVAQAVKRENEIALEQLEKAQLHLFPEGRPQERVISPFYYLFRYGPGLLGDLREAAADSLLLRSRRAPSGADETR